MKKLMQLMLCLFVLCCLSVKGHGAQMKYQTAEDLCRAWENNHTPDYVCGVWAMSGGSNYWFIGVEDDENFDYHRQLIMSQIEDHSTVSVQRVAASEAHLYDVFHQSNALYQKNIGLLNIVVNEKENKVQLIFLDTYMDNQQTQQEIENLRKEHGNVIMTLVQEAMMTSPEVSPDSLTAVVPAPAGQFASLIWLSGAAALGTTWITIQRASQKRRFLFTEKMDGELRTDRPLTCKDVKDQLRRTEPPVPEELDQRVRASIEAIKRNKK